MLCYNDFLKKVQTGENGKIGLEWQEEINEDQKL